VRLAAERYGAGLATWREAVLAAISRAGVAAGVVRGRLGLPQYGPG